MSTVADKTAEHVEYIQLMREMTTTVKEDVEALKEESTNTQMAVCDDPV